MYSPQNYITSGCGASMIVPIRNYPLSSITTTNNVDTDVKIDDISQYFATPREENHSGTEICYTNTPTTQLQPKVYPHQYKLIPSTQTTSFKPPPSRKEYCLSN